MKNMRCFEVTYQPVTNNLGSRVKIKDIRFRKRIFINYDHSLNNIFDMADNYLKSIGINCEVMGESGKGYFLLTNDFRTELK